MDSDTLLSQFAEASRGLLYMSETDAAFTAFAWPEMVGTPSAEAIKSREGYAAEDPIDVQTVPYFFRNAQDEERQRYDALAALLEATLADPQVFKIGRIRIKCYLVGAVKDGSGWAGLTTEVVET